MAPRTPRKEILLRLLVLTVFALAAAACAPALTGKPAPDFRVEEPSGRVWRLDDFRGKSSVVLVFYHSYG
jgi:hypothetical protein